MKEACTKHGRRTPRSTMIRKMRKEKREVSVVVDVSRPPIADSFHEA